MKFTRYVPILLALFITSGCEAPEDREERITARAICTAYDFLEKQGYSKLRQDVTDADVGPADMTFGGSTDPKTLYRLRFQRFGKQTVYAVHETEDFRFVFFRKKADTPCLRLVDNGKKVHRWWGLQLTCDMPAEAIKRSRPTPDECTD